MEPGTLLRVGREKLRIIRVERTIERRGHDIEHVTSLATRAVRKRRRVVSNVVPMPRGERTPLTDFLRYHALVRVFDGDVDAWLAQLEDEADVRFARGIRAQLRRNPSLLITIRQMVDATPFWGDTQVG
jgi:hypothetical protein